MTTPREAHDAWKQADAEAREMEMKLTQVWEQFEDRMGSPPGGELIQEVSRLRATANDKLTVALVEIGCVKRP
jgi:hypothetical protein